MRVLLQRVQSASVAVVPATPDDPSPVAPPSAEETEIVAQIGRGLLVFVGITPEDDRTTAERLAQKTVRLRIFPDPAADDDAMRASVADVGGQILVVSQFTLAADTRRGLRPSFSGAADPRVAEPLYEYFAAALEAELARPVGRGRFGANMQVALVNDGPVTLLLSS
ncbi:MAG: D-aminoacyl-tRNA deacylase [Pseudomonadota bacterium]